MLENIMYVVAWWGLFFLWGISFLPITFLIFPNFLDRGYAFAKIIGLLALTYLVWLLVSLNLLTYSRTTIFLCWFILLIINLIILYKNNILRTNFFTFLKERKHLLLITELIFLALFLLGVSLRFIDPIILRHAQVSENFMNLAFINKINTSLTFPPDDPWLTGFPLNYYYFGPLLASVITKALGVSINSHLGMWNISLFALTGTAIFGLGLSLTRKIRYGLLAVLLTMFTARLELIWAFLKQIPFEKIDWNNSGLIPEASNEFPFWEIVNHHPHSLVISSLMIVLALAILYQFLISKKGARGDDFYLILLGFVLGMIAFTHGWDLPAMLTIVMLGIILRIGISKSFFWQIPLLLTFIVLPFLPFWLNFQAPVKKLVLDIPKTNPIYIFIVFGLFLIPIGFFIISRLFGCFRYSPEKETTPFCIFSEIIMLVGLLLTLLPFLVYLTTAITVTLIPF